MKSERNFRTKRNGFTINLLETSQGFSIVQGTELLNKAQGHQNHPTQITSTNNSTHQLVTHPLKEFKSVFKKTNLIFDYASFHQPNLQQQQPKQDHHLQFSTKTINPQQINQNEHKHLLEWFTQKHKISEQQAIQRQDFDQSIQLYKQHRSQIIQLYMKEYYPNQLYLSAKTLRKFMVCDSFWVMKLHQLLQNLRIINIHSSANNINSTQLKHIFKQEKDHKLSLLSYDLQIKTQKQKNTKNIQQNKMIKEITSSLRPYCDYCRIQCGIVWFQHNRNLDSKEIVNIMKNVNTKNPPLSQKQYQYILCIKCYCQNRFPLLLTHHDFKKVCINDKLDPSRKKRNKKHKRSKNKRFGEEEGEEDGRVQHQQERSQVHQEVEVNKKEQISSIIDNLFNQCKKKQWTLEQTSYLLQLVQKYEDDWQQIHNCLKKRGYCQNLQTQDIILHFLSLPQRNISTLIEQYSQQEFIQQNLFNNTNSLNAHHLQQKLKDCELLKQVCTKQDLIRFREKAQRQGQWKKNINLLMKLQIMKLSKKLDFIQACQSTVQELSNRV